MGNTNALVHQPSGLPTNKLSAGVLACAAIEVVHVIVGHIYPWLDVSSMWAALTPLAVYAAGYLVHDADNTPAS